MPETHETETHSHPHETIGEQTPDSFKLVIGGIILALITLFAGIIGFLSLKQAPPQPPVVEQNTP
ncbi:hypothetical protein BH10PAT2_BH10PAT2_3980 [soil metagenome]